MTTTSKNAPLTDAAFRYLESGVCIIPIHPETKKPLVKWREFQDRLPTEDEVIGWQQLCAKEDIPLEDVKLAAVTGKISGFVIVDCDTPEAVAYAKEVGVWSPIRAHTKHGIHLYFRHPMDREFRPRVGSNSRGIDWPKVDGLDFRGDGSYALVPPSTNYSWDVDHGFALDDMDDWPVWSGWPMAKAAPAGRQLDFESLDLSGVEVKNSISTWEATEAYVRERFPSTMRIPSDMGNGRNQRVLAYAAEQVLHGHWGDALDERVCGFMDTFFAERLPEAEWKATCRSVEQMEKTNHPERFAADGSYIAQEVAQPKAGKPASPPKEEPIDWGKVGLIDYGKLPTYLVNRPPREFFLRPIIWNKSVTMIHGFAGQGKSTFIQLLLHSLMTERPVMEAGPFSVENRPRRVLVLNYEEDDFTHADRFELNSKIIGPLKKGSFIEYAPGVAEHSMAMPLSTEEGRALLTRMLQYIQPDILVIDNIRLAFPGMDENDAKAWVLINEMCLALRNAGLTVVLIHHANKGGDFSGSSNAITVLNTAISITQLYDNEDLATRLRGRYDKLGKRQEVLDYLPNQGNDWYLNFLMEATFSKARGFNDDYDHYYHMGLATYQPTGRQRLVCIPSTRQKAIELAFGQNLSSHQISTTGGINKSVSVVERWIEEEKRRRTP